MHAISSYRGNRPTNTPNTHRQTGPITIRCAAASAQCNNDILIKLQIYLFIYLFIYLLNEAD